MFRRLIDWLTKPVPYRSNVHEVGGIKILSFDLLTKQEATEKLYNTTGTTRMSGHEFMRAFDRRCRND